MSGPKWKKKDEEDDSEAWLGTYADAITLLMAFFVMLVSVSKIDIPLYEKVAAGIAKEIGKRETENPIEKMKIDLQDIVFSMEAEQAVAVGEDSTGIVMEFASNAFYKPGSAEFRDEAIPLLANVAETISSRRYARFSIEVEGHTDDDPISTALFPSNWELAAHRATNVVRFFAQYGMDPTRLRAVSYADTRPKFPNRTADGVPIPENKSENRRVVVRLYPHPQPYELPDIGRRTAAPEGSAADDPGAGSDGATDASGGTTGKESGKSFLEMLGIN